MPREKEKRARETKHVIFHYEKWEKVERLTSMNEIQGLRFNLFMVLY
jgi:hypothetical protein